MYGTVRLNVPSTALASKNLRSLTSKKSLYGLDRISLWVRVLVVSGTSTVHTSTVQPPGIHRVNISTLFINEDNSRFNNCNNRIIEVYGVQR